MAASAIESRPDAARDAVRTIQAASRTVLGEIGTLLDVLRTDDGGDGLSPQPGLDRLDELVRGFAESGLAVTVRTEGDTSRAAGVTGIIAYRVIQEALTNAHKHGAESRAHVLIQVDEHAVRIVVTNPAIPLEPDGREAADVGRAPGVWLGARRPARARGGGARRRRDGTHAWRVASLRHPAAGRDEPRMTTVLVVDDQSLIRQAVSDILSHAEGITVVGEAVDGQDAVTAAARLRPDVVVMDIRMPRLDGIAATAAICAVLDFAATKVLILTTFEEDEYIVAALRAGAGGFIGKGAEPHEIVHAVLAVDAGDALLSPAATRSLITRYVTPSPSRSDGGAPRNSLSSRTANARCCSSSAAGGPIRRSRMSCTSRRTRPRRTSTG